MAVSIVLLIVSVLVSSFSQILLKRAARVQRENRIKEYLNLPVVLAYSLFFASMMLTMVSLKRIPLSLAPIIESSGYFFVAVFSYLFLGERMNRRRKLGIAMILAGIVIASLSL